MKAKKPTSPIKTSTQSFIEIEAVKDDIIMLKDYSCCLIIQSGTTNFGLLSQEEQNSMIYSYSSLLNSLSFPIQILILSKRMDVSSYFDYLDIKIKEQTNQKIKEGLIHYQEFIKNIVKKNTILEKKFYFVIPFSPLEMGITSTAKTSLNKEYVIVRAKTSLYPKKDHLLRLLKRAGLGGRVLLEQEIVELFYNLYNPSTIGKKLAPISSYTDIVLTS
jgi:hypothetical protein